MGLHNVQSCYVEGVCALGEWNRIALISSSVGRVLYLIILNFFFIIDFFSFFLVRVIQQHWKTFPVLFFLSSLTPPNFNVAVVNIVDIYTYFGLEVDSFDCILVCVFPMNLCFFSTFLNCFRRSVIHVCKTLADGSGLLVL